MVRLPSYPSSKQDLMRCAGFCGVMSIFASLRYCLGSPSDHGNLWAALALMPFGLFFDFMDGKVARWRKKSSLMGQELDSLADLVNVFRLYNIQLANNYRSPSASLPLSQPLPSACALPSTTSSSPSSCSAALPALHASTSPLRTCPRTRRERANTSKERQSLLLSPLLLCSVIGSAKAGSWRTSQWVLGLLALF